jgi:hypothetical protein
MIKLTAAREITPRRLPRLPVLLLNWSHQMQTLDLERTVLLRVRTNVEQEGRCAARLSAGISTLKFIYQAQPTLHVSKPPLVSSR